MSVTAKCEFFIRGPAAAAVALEQIRDDTRRARLSVAFRLYYQVRQLMPLGVRQYLQQRRKIEAGDRWCFPDAFLESLAAAIERDAAGVPIIHPWPHGRRFALVLTHDVETAEGLRLIPRLAEIEEQFGFRSSWNVVPYKYKIDDGLVRELQSRSFEIGIHGYNHDGRLYSSRREFERRAVAINRALARYQAVGFRSPMVHRNLDWLQGLEIRYDASCFDIDPYQAMPGGVGGIWPFVAGKFIELPYTLPQDHTLFVARGECDGQTWEKKRDYLIRHHGMLLMLTHPDYMTTPERLEAYRRFLAATQEIGGYWHALPREVADWWNGRGQSTVAKAPGGEWTIEGPASQAGVIAALGVRDGRLSLRTCPSAKAGHHALAVP